MTCTFFCFLSTYVLVPVVYCTIDQRIIDLIYIIVIAHVGYTTYCVNDVYLYYYLEILEKDYVRLSPPVPLSVKYDVTPVYFFRWARVTSLNFLQLRHLERNLTELEVVQYFFYCVFTIC